MKAPRIPCPNCKGHGEVPLPETLASVLRYLVETGPSTVAEIHRASVGAIRREITPNAFNNRLEDLRALGLVTREKDGRRWVYSATAKRRRAGR